MARFFRSNATTNHLNPTAPAQKVSRIKIVVVLFILPALAFVHFQRLPAVGFNRFYFQAGIVTLLAFGVFGLTEDWLSRMPLLTTYTVAVSGLLAGMANELNLDTLHQ